MEEAGEEERLRRGDRLLDLEGVREMPPSGEQLRLRLRLREDLPLGLDVGETLREALRETLLGALLGALRERDRARREPLRDRPLEEEDL